MESLNKYQQSTVTPTAFMFDTTAPGNDPRWYHGDIYRHEDEETTVLTKMGVTFFVNNDATIATGSTYKYRFYNESRTRTTTAGGGLAGGFNYSWVFNHVMSSYDTVAPTASLPVEPTPPEKPDYVPLPAVPPMPQQPVEPPKPDYNPLNDLPEIPEVPQQPVPPVAPEAPQDTVTFWKATIADRGVLKVNKELPQNEQYYVPGQEVPFTIEVANDGADVLTDVILYDLPDKHFVTGSFAWQDTAGGTVLDNTELDSTDRPYSAVSLGTLNPGDKRTLTARAIVSEQLDGQDGINTVRATSPDDPDKGLCTQGCQVNATVAADTDGYDAVSIAMIEAAAPGIEITKYINNEDANDEQSAAVLAADANTMTVDYVVTNTGNTALKDITVTDDIDFINKLLANARTVNLDGSLTSTHPDVLNGKITLQPGETAVLRLENVTAPIPGALHTNTGTVTALPDDVRTASNPTQLTSSDPANAIRKVETPLTLPRTGDAGMVAPLLALLALAGGTIGSNYIGRHRRETT